ncbi:MAG: hypothetical protein MUO57_13655 [Anaerolineales bacterium]|nr:hypothetical protein [Anaerolineales bacterium]
MKYTDKQYLHELSKGQLASVVTGWQDGIKLLRKIISLSQRAIAFNAITHNGPGAGQYFEFLPYSQEERCFEKLGFSVCQSNPEITSELLKDRLDH